MLRVMSKDIYTAECYVTVSQPSIALFWNSLVLAVMITSLSAAHYRQLVH